MDDKALLLSLGFARPSAREAMESFKEAFPGVSTREGGRVRAFDERTTIGLMLGQALGHRRILQGAREGLAIHARGNVGKALRRGGRALRA